MKKPSFILVLIAIIMCLGSAEAGQHYPSHSPRALPVTGPSPEQSLSYEDWLNGLGMCYNRRPYKDDLASRMISRFPEYNARYIDDMISTSAKMATLGLVAALATKKDSPAKQTVNSYFDRLGPFVQWYVDLSRNAMEDAQFRRLEDAVGY